MPLPGGLSTFTLQFGPYTDLEGNVSFAGMQGVLSVSPAIVDSTTGAQIFKSVTFVIGNDGTATVGPLVASDEPRINQGTQYSVAWQALSYKETPGNKTFVVPRASGSTVDYDSLASASGSIAGPYVLPLVTSVVGQSGSVSGSEILADSTVAAALGGKANIADIPRAGTATGDALRAALVSKATGAELARGDSSAPLTAPVPSTLASTTLAVALNGQYPAWLSDDRTQIFGAQGTLQLQWSTDDGATWQSNSYVFPNTIQSVRQAADGEMIVGAGGSTTASTGALYRSSGWKANPATATFTKVQDASSPGVYFHNSWGLYCHDNIVLAAEYGAKTAGANARYLYLSQNYGATFTTIYDLGSADQTHLHGVCYDPYWERIWLSHGDVTNHVYYSDDMGVTWQQAAYAEPTLKNQVTTIFPLRDCVLFLSDSAPNGVLRVRRSQRKSEQPVMEVAYRLNTNTTISHLGHLMFRAKGVPGAPLLMSFAVESSSGFNGPGFLLGTVDGYRFFELWRDSHSYADQGLLWTMGPTALGNYVGNLDDDRQVNNSRIVWPAPTWTTREVLHKYSKRNGQDGYVAPSSRHWTPSTLSLPASGGRAARFMPDRDVTVTRLSFALAASTTTDDQVEGAILDSTLTVIGRTGAVSGQLNSSANAKTLTLQSPVNLKAGEVYYAALACGTQGGTAATVVSAAFQTGGAVRLFGATAGTAELQSFTGFPIPASITLDANPPSSCPLLAVRD